MPAAVTSVQVTGDGQAILVGSLDSQIRLMDRMNGTCLRALGGLNKELRIKSCFGKREAIVMSGEEGTGMVNAWDVMTGEIKAEALTPCGPAPGQMEWFEFGATGNST